MLLLSFSPEKLTRPQLLFVVGNKMDGNEVTHVNMAFLSSIPASILKYWTGLDWTGLDWTVMKHMANFYVSEDTV
jgi:hypothetical protein